MTVAVLKIESLVLLYNNVFERCRGVTTSAEPDLTAP